MAKSKVAIPHPTLIMPLEKILLQILSWNIPCKKLRHWDTFQLKPSDSSCSQIHACDRLRQTIDRQTDNTLWHKPNVAMPLQRLPKNKDRCSTTNRTRGNSRSLTFVPIENTIYTVSRKTRQLWWFVSSKDVDKFCSILLQSITTLLKIMPIFILESVYVILLALLNAKLVRAIDCRWLWKSQLHKVILWKKTV